MSTQAAAGRPGAARRSSGPVRSQDAHDLVMRAVIELLEDVGYGRVTIEGVAARSGVAKSTIYRWWASKPVLVMDAYARVVNARVPTPDTADLAADLTAFMTSLYRIVEYPVRARALRGLMAEAQLDPTFEETFREWVRGRRDVVTRLLQGAIERGELPAALDLTHAVDLVFGPFWYRLLVGHAPLDPNEAAGHVRTLLIGWRHRPSATGDPAPSHPPQEG
jgi:AcrR family transcriptional regulator